MIKFKARKDKLSRQDLADPFHNMSYYERLVKSASIDLENNHLIEVLDYGYVRIKPIDKNKIVR